MIKVRISSDWRFKFESDISEYNTYGLRKCGEAEGAAERFRNHNNWEKTDIPHDWAIRLPISHKTSTNCGAGRNITDLNDYTADRRSNVENLRSVGWYRKIFFADEKYKNKRIYLEFEGVSKNYIIWVNGAYMERHLSGYIPCVIDITDNVMIGEENSIAVRVDSDQCEGWWYEGAGIYRHVNLLIGENIYIEPYNTFVKSETDGKVEISAIISNATEISSNVCVSCKIKDSNGNVVAEACQNKEVETFASEEIRLTAEIADPVLWDLDNPYLYTVELRADNDVEITKFGIREILFDADKGFFLNGKRVQLNGACVHQDFGGVGVALSDNLHSYKIAKLKEMGVNAYRCSHNPPAPELLDACDELGMLVMDETRLFGSSPEALRQIKTLVKRDRNHPSVILWSIGNEEHTTQSCDWGKRIAITMKREIRKLDTTRPVIYGGNNGMQYEGANEIADVRGINYIRNMWVDECGTDKYHNDHPHQPMLASEETSFITSRGNTVNALERNRLNCFGDVTMPWGITPQGLLRYYDKHPYLCGSFMWTGFDYRGEPTPFDTRAVSSSFGAIDLCGFEKPVFYYFKAWWDEKTPMLKILPHWNYEIGEQAEIGVCTNFREITLYLNGKKIETRSVEKYDFPRWILPFEPGTIRVEGIKDGKQYSDEIHTAGEVALIKSEITLQAQKKEDVSIVTLSAFDKEGNLCRISDDIIKLDINGGEIVGVGNGDPLCTDYEQKPLEEETRNILYRKEDEKWGVIPPLMPINTCPAGVMLEHDADRKWFEDDYRDVYDNKAKDTEDKVYTLEFEFAEKFSYIEFERFCGDAVIYLNGEEIGKVKQGVRKGCRPFRFECKFKKGINVVRVESKHSIGANGFEGNVFLGRVKETPWHVRLHCGLARVFVKSDGEFSVMANPANE